MILVIMPAGHGILTLRGHRPACHRDGKPDWRGSRDGRHPGDGTLLESLRPPAKLQNASASIDRIGEEGRVIPTTFVISIMITLVYAGMTLLWAYG
jgi:hypothetical protein